MIDPINPINPITSIVRSAANPIINQAQRNETVIKILKKLKFDPAHPPKDFDGVYAYALVEYGVDKPEVVLELFREEAIKDAFWKTFSSGKFQGFYKEVEKFLNWNILGDKIGDAKIEPRQEIEEFYKVFVDVAQRTRNPAEVIRDNREFGLNEEPLNQSLQASPSPDEFKSLIQEKIRTFCGRDFVFEAFKQFTKDNPCGYFTVIGDAGMGKSAIAAKYVSKHQAICYFNILAEGRNRSELFLKSIRQQLINRYGLQGAEDVDLRTLLAKVSEKLTSGGRLVIVVDALDEVEQEPGDNLLHLPMTLPDGVYFLLTRRPYNLNKKRLSVSPGVPVKELDLTAREYVDFNREDIKEYIRFVLNNDSEHKDALNKWIQERNINREKFVEQVGAKSENNFMYLRYVLPGIARGFYDDLSLRQLPDGLQDYYQTHWVRMGMETAPQELMAIVLFILVEIGTPIPSEMVAAIAQEDEYEVQSVLDQWVEYLRKQEIEGERCYSIYHASFLDFLEAKREMTPTRRLFQEVNQQIGNYLDGEMS